MSDPKLPGPWPAAPAPSPGTVTQITAVTITSTDAHYVQLFALCADGSIWRLQEWRPGQWEELSLPHT